MKIDSLGDVVMIRRLFIVGEHKKDVLVKIEKPKELKIKAITIAPTR